MNPISEYFGSKEPSKETLNPEVAGLLQSIGNDAGIREDLHKNKVMKGTDWEEWDQSVERRVNELNKVLRTGMISSEQLVKWMKRNSKPHLNYAERFWIFINDGAPQIALNHFYRFNSGKERLQSVVRQMKN